MDILELLFGTKSRLARESGFQSLMLATIFPVLGTALLSPVLDSLINPLGADPSNIGLLISTFTAPAIVMIPVTGLLTDRYGRKPILVVSLVVFGAAGSAIAFTTHFETILVLRGLQGIGFSGINPVIVTSIGDIYEGNREVTAQGLRLMGSGLSGAIFPFIAGILVIFAWQYPFLLYAVSIPIAVVVYLNFEEPTGIDPNPKSDTDDESYLAELFELLRHRHIQAILIARGLPIVVWFGFLTYNSIIVVRLIGGTPTEAGLLIGVGNLIFAVTASQVGRVLDGGIRQFPVLLLANVSLGVGLGIIMFSLSVNIALIGVVIVGAGFGITMSLYRNIVTGLAPPQLRGGLVSLSEAGGTLSATLTPMFMGGTIALMTSHLGFTAALQLAGVIVAISGGGGGLLCLVVASRYAARDVPSHADVIRSS